MNRDAKLPTRIIDVGMARNGSEEFLEPRLLVTSGSDIGQWVALSHCWGNEPPFISTIYNLSNRMRQLQWSDLPATFRDAIIITRKLGYRYLWIDSLCILQDSPDEWTKEASRMSAYYGDAVVTIASCWTKNQTDGILNKRQTLQAVIKILLRCKSMAEPGSFYVRTYPRSLDYEMNMSPWSCRGWTFQERLLSRRVIYYGQNQLFWQCSKSARYEGRDDPEDHVSKRHIHGSRTFGRLGLDYVLNSSYPDTTSKLAAIMLEWMRIIQEYASKQLKMPVDIFPALSGIARRIAEKTGYHYRAGIWLEAVWISLLWVKNVHVSQIDWRPRGYRAPSWSWASLRP
jgi:hypothetical protein